MTTTQRLLFTAVLTCISVGMHTYIASRLMAGANLTPRGRRIAWVLALISGLTLPWVFRLMPLTGVWWADLLQFAGWIFFGVFSLVLAFTLLLDLILLLVRIVGRLSGRALLPVDPERRRFLRRILNYGVLGVTALVSGAAFVQARRLATVKRVKIPIEGLPEALRGLKIAQISDLHVGPTIRDADMRGVVEIVNSLGADMVAVTGDLVDGTVDRIAADVAPLGELSSRHGTFFVTGNHEYFSGAEPWLEHCRDVLGWQVLGNEHAVVDHDGARLVVAGVYDLTAQRFVEEHTSDPTKALTGAPEADLRVLLAHQPKSVLETEGLDVDLQLSGHTHGGQYFPFTVLLSLALRFTTGLQKVGKTWLYINAGTTYWGPPFRLGSAQEITLLELERA